MLRFSEISNVVFRRRRVPSEVQQLRIDRRMRIVIIFFRWSIETYLTSAENENYSTVASFCYPAEARKEITSGKKEGNEAQ
jgi:hypothetical protein